MRVHTRIWLERFSVDGPIFARLVQQNDLGFTPKVIRIGTSTGTRESRFESASLIAKTADLQHAKLIGGPGESLALTGYAGQRVEQLLWELPRAPEDFSLVEAVSQLPGFCFAYTYDADDVMWQSERSIGTYELKGRDHAHLPKVRGKGLFPWEDEFIDITDNPGRERVIGGLMLLPAPKMWFGTPAFQILNREKLLAFSETGIREDASGSVRVDLFPLGLYELDLPAVREVQARFADYMSFDSLESEAPKEGG